MSQPHSTSSAPKARKAHLRTLSPQATACGLALLAAGLLCTGAWAASSSPTEELQRHATQAGRAGVVESGRIFFQSKHGFDQSCSSCHGMPPTQTGQHSSTGKNIAPLAPAFNPRGLTDSAKVDKWFRRNCQDVLRRECTAAEKVDVLAYLLSLKP